MKFKILQHFTSVEVYLSQFLKVSKKNINKINSLINQHNEINKKSTNKK